MEIIEGKLTLEKESKIAIITSRFNSFFTEKLTDGAKDTFLRSGGELKNLDMILVPGAFEIPLALNALLNGKNKYDGICCLGAVIKGATPHFDYVCAEATKGIAHLSLKYNFPVSFGLLTTNTLEQTMERSGSKSGNKGCDAMVSLIEMINLYKNIK